MNVTKENLSHQVELINVTVEPADYTAVVDGKLKELKRKASVPGFRPGMVPMQLVKKMYFKNVLSDEAYQMASQKLYSYIQENKIEIIADPMPSEKQVELNFEDGETLVFSFEIAVLEPVNIDLSSLSLDKYLLTINDEMREGYKSNLLNRFGELVDVEAIAKDEAVTVTLEQEDMKIEDAYVGLISMSDEARAPFIGKKVGDVMDVDVNELYPTPSQRAAILSVKEEELEGLNPKFTLTITRIRKFALPEMTEEFYAKAFPDGSIKSSDELAAYVDASLRRDLDKETFYKMILDTREKVVEESGITLPEEFLQNWLYVINKEKFSKEDIAKDFPQFVNFMKWDVIKKHFVTEGDIKVEQEDILNEAKGIAMSQFLQYGMSNVDDAMLDNYAQHILNNNEEKRKIFDSLYDTRVVDYIASKALVVEKEVTIEEFREIIK